MKLKIRVVKTKYVFNPKAKLMLCRGRRDSPVRRDVTK